MMKMSLVVVLGLMIVSGVQANLLVNGDFEGGSVTGYWMPTAFDSAPWSRFAWGGDVKNAWLTDGGGNNDGGVVGEITPDDMAMKWRWSGAGIVQTVEATADTEYTFSVDVFNSAIEQTANDWGIDLKVNFRDDAGLWIGDVVQITRYDSAVEAAGTWVTVSGSVLTPAGTSDLQLRIIASGAGGGGYLYADNASVTPEPATLALLGLGSLVLARRKK